MLGYSVTSYAQQNLLDMIEKATFSEAMSRCSEYYDKEIALSGTVVPLGAFGKVGIWILHPETRPCNLAGKSYTDFNGTTFKTIDFYTLLSIEGDLSGHGPRIKWGEFWYIAGTESIVEAPEPSCGVMFGNPIDTLSGNKHESVDDIVAGPAGISFKRYYNSAISRHYRYLGRGWTYSFSSGVYPSLIDDSLVVVDDRGYGSAYKRDGQSNIFININGDSIEKVYVGSVLNKYVHIGRSSGVLNEVYGPEGQLLERKVGSEHYTLSYLEGLSSYITNSTIALASVVNGHGRLLQFAYNAEGLLISVSDDSGQVVSFDYEEGPVQRLLKGVAYAGGGGYRYAYDSFRLVEIADQSGAVLSSFGYDKNSWKFGFATSTSKPGDNNKFEVGSRTYNPNSNLGQYTVYGPRGVENKIKYEFVDGIRRPVEFLYPCSDYKPVKSITYLNDGKIASETDFRGRTDSYEYDATGRRTSSVEASGSVHQRKVETDWHSSFNVPVESRVYDAAGMLVARTGISYNARGQPLSISQIDPLLANTARTSTVSYCEQADVDTGICPLVGLVIGRKGPRNDVYDATGYTYYSGEATGCSSDPVACSHRKGDLWKVTNALGQVTEMLRYDAAGRLLSVRSSDGVVTDFEYHPRGWLMARKVRGANDTTESDDAITLIDYSPLGLIAQVKQADGSQTSFGYDAAQRLIKISDNAGNSISYTLDNGGERVKEEVKDTAGVLRRSLSRVFNQRGQLEAQADAGGNSVDFSYDANGNAILAMDALGRVSASSFDPLNRLVQASGDVGGISASTSFKYDALDSLTEVVDPRGLKTTYGYDGLGQPKTTSSPDTGAAQRTFDAAGNVKTIMDARGVVRTYAYDALNRVTSVSYPGQGEDVSYAYDTAPSSCGTGENFGVGRLSSMLDASGRTEYCYNRFGDIVRKVQVTNGKAFVVRYTYAIGGNLASVIYPDGAVADYVRDAKGQITEVGVTSGSGGRQVLLTGAGYLPFGPSTGWQYGNGRTLVRNFDLDYRPTAVLDSGHDLKIRLGYDAVSNITALESGNYAAGLSYDALGRLTEFRDSGANVAIDQYRYDATGNRLSVANAGGSVSYNYDSASHRLSSVGAIGRSYDAVGNTVSLGNGARELVYNQSNRLSQVKVGGVVAQRYAYNAEGERVQRGMDAGTSVYTTYDEAGHWLGDYDALGKATQQVIWMDDMPVGLLAEGVLHYIEPDHLGTPRLVFNPMRNVSVWTWDIKGEAFGNSVPNQDPDGDSQAFVFDMRFPGQRYDAISGLNYNYFRDYDSSTGRYVQSDPIGLAGGISTYGYVGGAAV